MRRRPTLMTLALMIAMVATSLFVTTAGVGPFVQEYEGQTYYYFSDFDEATGEYEAFEFAPRAPYESLNPTSGVNNSGFSDPEFAIDMAGNVYVSEINLANIAVSKSDDGGRTYTLQNLLGLTASDRQWMEADEEDVVYMTANTFGGGSLGDRTPGVTGSLANRMYKSTDGGVTWGPGQQFFGSSQMSSDFKIDHSDGRIYMLDTRLGGRLELVVLDARGKTLAEVQPERFLIAEGYSNLSSIGPTLDLDEEGNVYVVWDQVNNGTFPGGIYFTAATQADLDEARGEEDTFVTRGQAFAAPFQTPIKLDTGSETAQWPWVVAGDVGNASVTWIENVAQLAGQDSENADADQGWNVYVAQSTSVFGCDEVDGDHIPGFNEVVASSEPVHSGTMCASGTTCQAFAIDRRLGDYFSNELDANGNTVIAVSDTRKGGPVSLPLLITQVDGPTLGQGGYIPSGG